MKPLPSLLPDDESNRVLMSRVHPTDWQNPEPADRYNLLVIGAGTAGLVAAAGAAGLGAKVALVERGLMGGDCLNWGCVPSKAILRSSRIATLWVEAELFGFKALQPLEADFPRVMERMRRLRARLAAHDSAARFRDLGVDVFLGHARFTGSHSAEVEGRSLRFRKAVIATGAKPVIPPIPGLVESGCLTNETIFQLTKLPRRLLVIGGGPIGCELAQAFRRLGSELTLVEMGAQILPREDEDVSSLMQAVLQREGIDLRLRSTVQRVTSGPNEKQVRILQDGNEAIITVDAILAAAGRAPNVLDLNLEAAGVAYDERAGIHVDRALRTTNPDIYAAGDVCLKYQFTHAADAAARLVIRNALFPGHTQADSLIIPWCTYTDPEIAHAGVGEAEARRRDIPFDVYKRTFDSVDRAILDGEEIGFIKILTPKGRDRILGAIIVARHAGEMLNEITLAMNQGIGLGKLSHVIHPYPTQAAAIRQCADDYNRSRLTPWRKKILQAWFRWRRECIP